MLLGCQGTGYAQVGRAFETALLGLPGTCRQPQRGDGHSTMHRHTQEDIRIPQAAGSPRDTVHGCAGDPGIPWHSLAFPGILHFQQPGADPPLPPTMALARVAARSQDFSPCSG